MSKLVDFWSRKVTRNLFFVCDQLEMDVPDLADLIERDPVEIKRELFRSSGPSVPLVDLIADRLNIPLEDFFVGKADCDQIRRWKTGDYSLPSRYQLPKGSRNRSLLTILQYIRTSKKNHRLYRSIFRELRIHEEGLKDPNQYISIRLIDDVCRLLAAKGFCKNDFYLMGLMMAQVPENDEVQRAFSGVRSLRELFEYGIEVTARYVDCNFDYSLLETDDNYVLVRIAPKQHLEDFFNTKVIHSRWTRFYRQGVAAGHPQFIGLKPAYLSEVQNLHSGADSDVYRLEWGPRVAGISHFQ